MLKHIRIALGSTMLVSSLAVVAQSAPPSAANLMTYEGVNGQRYFSQGLLSLSHSAYLA